MVRLGEARIYLTGIWMLARNDPRGFDRLDLSADGFWRSFTAVLYALPAFFLSWINYRNIYLGAAAEGETAGAGFFLTLALIDLVNWLAPVILVGLLAGPLGIAAQFGRWVIATNWLSVPIAYAMSVPVVLILLIPDFEPVGVLVSLVLFGFAVSLLFRVTRLSLGDWTIAFAITLGLIFLSFTVSGVLQGLFGIDLPAAD